MKIVGCDLHTRYQQIAMLDQETGTSAPTHLTQAHRREAKGAPVSPPPPAPQQQNICRGCGKALAKGSIHCAACAAEVSGEKMLEVARQGRIASKSLDARARVATTQRRQAIARYSWNPSTQPQWLTEEV